MKTTENILDAIRKFKPTAKKLYGINILGVFGSVARGEQREDSDIDVCYDGNVLSLLTLDKLQCDLERILDSKVDLVRMHSGMNSMLRTRILKEARYV